MKKLSLIILFATSFASSIFALKRLTPKSIIKKALKGLKRKKKEKLDIIKAIMIAEGIELPIEKAKSIEEERQRIAKLSTENVIADYQEEKGKQENSLTHTKKKIAALDKSIAKLNTELKTGKFSIKVAILPEEFVELDIERKKQQIDRQEKRIKEFEERRKKIEKQDLSKSYKESSLGLLDNKIKGYTDLLERRKKTVKGLELKKQIIKLKREENEIIDEWDRQPEPITKAVDEKFSKQAQEKNDKIKGLKDKIADKYYDVVRIEIWKPFENQQYL